MRPPRSPQPLGRRVTDLLPGWLRCHLAVVLGEQGAPLYLAGGVVRDLLRGVTPADIDLTVRDGARAWAARLAKSELASPSPQMRRSRMPVRD